MSFAYPEYGAPLAVLGIALAVLAGISWLLARRRTRRLLGSPRFVRRGALASDLVLLAAFAAIGAALLGPELGQRTIRVPASGVDLVLLVDVSRSMDAADVPPSRLTRARELALAVLGRLEPEDRAALAVFADRGVVLAPLTPDADALGELVAAVDGDLVVPRGSDLGAGVAAALGTFDPASERPRVVLVLGDGEDADGRDSGAALAHRAGARVVAVALGTESGAEIPIADHTVVSRRDAARLDALAAATDGIALRADRWGDVDLAALVAALRRDAARASGGMVERRVPADRSAPLAALALALLALEAIQRAKPIRLAIGAAVVLAIASLASATGPDDAIARLETELRAKPGDPHALVALGVARAGADHLDEAARALRAAALGAVRSEDAAMAYFDLGVVELRRKRLEAARTAFLDALALAPEDGQARFNLEWTARALATTAPADVAKSADDDAPERDERPEPDATPPGDASLPQPSAGRPQPAPRPDAGRGFAPELSPDRVEKWLAAVSDDPRRGFRGSAGPPDGGRSPRPAAARW